MRYTGIQPQYFPRLHYFARILNADFFVIRDEVQFVRKHKYPDGRNDYSYQATSQIKTATGIFHLTVPIHKPGYSPINEIRIAQDEAWIAKHLKTIEYAYRRAPFFLNIFPDLNKILRRRYASLSALTVSTILWGLLRILGQPEVVSSELNIEVLNKLLARERGIRLKNIRLSSKMLNKKQLKKLSANEKILTLIRGVGANEDYCGGTAVSAYMDRGLFKRHGIKVAVQDWKCATYPQLFVKEQGFIANLSIIDLLMNVSPRQAKAILIA